MVKRWLSNGPTDFSDSEYNQIFKQWGEAWYQHVLFDFYSFNEISIMNLILWITGWSGFGLVVKKFIKSPI